MTRTHATMRPNGRSRLIASAGVLLLAGTLVSSAAYVDEANLNLGGVGVGYAGTFDIGVVLPDGTVEQADADEGFDWVVDGAETLVPGESVTTRIPVFNNTPDLVADTVFEVTLRNGDGSVTTDIPNITTHLRFTARDTDGRTLFSGATWDAARGPVGVLSPRGLGSQAPGDIFITGAEGSDDAITLTIDYLDAPGVEELNGGQAALSVRFDAVSAIP